MSTGHSLEEASCGVYRAGFTPIVRVLAWMNEPGVFALAFALGAVAGLRALTAPAVVSWAARFGWLDLRHTWLAFLGYAVTPYVFTAFAIFELVMDKLPKTPSRKMPAAFASRVVLGAFSGAALCMAAQYSPAAGALCGGFGAVVGTLGGYEARTSLVKGLGAPDLVIALLEDAIAWRILHRLAILIEMGLKLRRGETPDFGEAAYTFSTSVWE